MKTGTDAHPKFKNLVALLDLRYYEAIGILEGIWQLAMMSANKGDIGKFTNEEISNALQWRGDADGLIDALVKSRWLDAVEDDRRLVIHDWHDHAPDFIRKRLVYNGEMFNSFRSDSQRTAYILRDSQRTAKTRRDSRDKPLHHVPNQVPNQEYKAPSAPSPKTPPPEEEAEEGFFDSKEEIEEETDSFAVLTFPCNGPVKAWRLTASKVAEYQESFPGMDILAEARKALQWIRDNPEKRKTAKGLPRFLGSWLTRANDRPAGNGNGSRPSNRYGDDNPPGWKPTIYGKPADPDIPLAQQRFE
jgi:hypothetical protein